MKPFNEVTSKELCSLSHEEIEKYKQLALADEGIPLGLNEILPPEKPTEPKPVKEAYTIEIPYQNFFASREELQRVVDQLNKLEKVVVTYGKDYSYKFLSGNRPSSVTVSEIPIHDKEELQAFDKETEEYKAILGEVQEENEKNIPLIERRDEICAKIDSEIAYAKRYEYKMKSLYATWNEYLILSDGNTDIAENFFHKAYPSESLQEVIVFNEEN